MSSLNLTAYLAHSQFLPDLQQELQMSVDAGLIEIKNTYENLILARGPSVTSVWAQCIAYDVQIIPITSIGETAKFLRSQGKQWALYSVGHHRRAQLIQEQLPKFKNQSLDFRQALSTAPCGLWSLLEKDSLLYGKSTNLPIPLGEIKFNEDKINPPSRAYLKLWELLTIYGVFPRPGERVIDFGSCPGGWTWVLQQIGCQVVSIDKAPLAPNVAALPRVEFIKADAFALDPKKLGLIDWFFSDIICYPPKLFELVKQWQDEAYCKNFVCTIKFQGETDFETVTRFQQELGARVIHLYHNKHEVTAIICS